MWKRLSVVWSLVKGDAKLLWYALQHPEAPAWLKWGTVAVVLYLVSDAASFTTGASFVVDGGALA